MNMNETTTPTPTIDDRRDALRWLIDNRREEISFEEAIKTLRFALHNDAEALRLIAELTTEPPH